MKLDGNCSEHGFYAGTPKCPKCNKLNFWAIYTVNVGSSYEPDIVMQMIADETLEKLSARIPSESVDVYVTTSAPVRYSLKFVPTLIGE